jgi:hypothetical protein
MFKISLRELFLIIAIAALGLSWWLDRSTLAAEAALHKEGSMKLMGLGFNVGDMLKMPELASKLEAEYAARHQR